jgi:hypothetical protein
VERERYGFANDKPLGEGPHTFEFQLEREVTERLTIKINGHNEAQASALVQNHPEELEGMWETYDRTDAEVLTVKSAKREKSRPFSDVSVHLQVVIDRAAQEIRHENLDEPEGWDHLIGTLEEALGLAKQQLADMKGAKLAPIRRKK